MSRLTTLPGSTGRVPGFSLALVGSRELWTAVQAYTAQEIQAEIDRCRAQLALDNERLKGGYRGLVSAPGFWDARIDVLTAALA